MKQIHLNMWPESESGVQFHEVNSIQAECTVPMFTLWCFSDAQHMYSSVPSEERDCSHVLHTCSGHSRDSRDSRARAVNLSLKHGRLEQIMNTDTLSPHALLSAAKAWSLTQEVHYWDFPSLPLLLLFGPLLILPVGNDEARCQPLPEVGQSALTLYANASAPAKLTVLPTTKTTRTNVLFDPSLALSHCRL